MPNFPGSIDRFQLAAHKHSCHLGRYKHAGPGLSHLTQAHIIRERTEERVHVLSRIFWKNRQGNNLRLGIAVGHEALGPANNIRRANECQEPPRQKKVQFLPESARHDIHQNLVLNSVRNPDRAFSYQWVSN